MKWFKRARQTRTDIHDEAGRLAMTRLGERKAYRATLCAQMTAQVLLWVTLQAWERGAQATWQAVIMLALPLAALFWLWRAAQGGLSARGARYALLLLVPCLMADAAVLMAVADAMMGEMVPSYSPHARVIVIAGFACVTVCSARKNGVAYGVSFLRHLLVLLFVLSTVFLGADVRVDRLWPLLGAGLGQTALTALTGAGCVWGVALLFTLPARPKAGAPRDGTGRAALWAAAPLLLGLVWALWYGMARVWRGDDAMTIGERMTALARNSQNILLSELAGLGWLILLPCALCGCLMSGEKLLAAAAPKLPKLAAVLLLALPAAAFAFFCGDDTLSWLSALLPWRAALSAAAGAAVWLLGRGKGGNGA